MSKLRILFLPLDFSRWQTARYNGYTLQMGIDEVLSSRDVECTVVPAVCPASYAEINQGLLCPWFYRLKELLGSQSFDQVWLEVVHTNMTEEFLEWVASLAPIRVGFIGESLSYSEQTYTMHPILRVREQLVLTRARYLTHVLTWDEVDLPKFAKSHPTLKAEWWPQMVPERIFRLDPGPILHHSGVFLGSLYGERRAWLEHPELRNLIKLLPPPEENSRFPAKFDELQRYMEENLASKQADLAELLKQHIATLRQIRRAIFDMWINTMRDSALIVNLPQFGSGYAGRVIEALACSRPVLARAPVDRPRTSNLFQDGKEIVHYSMPDDLAQKLKILLNEPELARSIGAAGRAKVAEQLSTERMVDNLLAIGA